MIKELPLVSVIIPSYNRAKFIVNSIQSVLNQTYTNFELIVVDDCSTDNSIQLIKKINNPKINLIIQEENKGACVARNTGIKYAKGKYIAFLDSDDQWYPNKLEKQVNIIEKSNPNIGFVDCGFIRYSDIEKKVVSINIPNKRGELFHDALRYCVISAAGSCALIKKDVFKKSGLWDPNFKAIQIQDMFIRITKYFQGENVPEILARINQHGTQIGFNVNRTIQGYSRLLKKYYNKYYINYPFLMIDILFNLGRLKTIIAKTKEEQLIAKQYLIHLLRFNFFNIQAYFYLIGTLIPVKYFQFLFRWAHKLNLNSLMKKNAYQTGIKRSNY